MTNPFVLVRYPAVAASLPEYWCSDCTWQHESDTERAPMATFNSCDAASWKALSFPFPVYVSRAGGRSISRPNYRGGKRA